MGVSADGSVIVGIKPRDDNPNRAEPFVWTSESGVVGLASVMGITREAGAMDVSADGSVTVGFIGRRQLDAFHWSADTGLTLLGDFPGGLESTQAVGVSADGRVVVGGSVTEFSWRAFRWSEQIGFAMIGELEGFGVTTGASAASADGSVIVGNRASNDMQTYRWTEQTGMVLLSDPSGRFYQHWANDVTPDGRVIVGQTLIQGSRHQAFIWDRAHGMRDLGEVLETDYGLDLTGWAISRPEAISADGRTIVGNVVNPDTWTEAFVAFLGDPIPCPGDINGDRLVSLSDLAILLANFGIPDGATPADGDLDNDGDTDAADLQTLLEHFGALCPL